jgi:hypothetical protein
MMSGLPAAVLNSGRREQPSQVGRANLRVTNILRLAGVAALAIPVLLSAWFVTLYSTAMPLTDEWFFLRAVAALEEITFTSFSSLGRIAQLVPYKIYDHDVIVPFLVYWPIAELSNFDNRALLVVTLAVWAIVLVVFRFYIVRSSWWTLPIALILFSPARYMELLWGFQFTLALSILFPILGLVVLSRIRPEDGAATQLRKALGATALVITGTLSSAGGFFGFIGAIVVLSFLRLPRGNRLILLELLTGAMIAVYFVLMRDSGRVPVIDLRNILFILTALGSSILGMPDAFTRFGVDARSVTGAAVVLLMLAAIVIGARRRIFPALALPAGIFAFGLTSLAAIAVARQYLGNWHLAYAVPAVTAAYAAAYIVFREIRSVAAAQLCLSAMTALMLAIFAYYNGFTEYGPQYNSYIRSIEQYARSYLANPSQAKPFPGTGGWDLDANMVWFLAEKGHRVFDAGNRMIFSAPRIPFPQAKFSVSKNSENERAHVLVAAALPPGERADALILRTARADVILRKTDPRLVAPLACAEECFTAWVPSGNLPADIPAALSAVGFVSSGSK